MTHASHLPTEAVVDDKDEPYRNRTYVIVETHRDEPGALMKAINAFREFNVNMTHIESRLNTFARQSPTFHIDFEGRSRDPKVQQLLSHLRQSCTDVVILPDRPVQWFPVHIRELDLTRETLDGGTDLISQNHPGFNDLEYRARRNELSALAQTYRHGQHMPRVRYTDQETKTWGTVYGRLRELHKFHACNEINEVFPDLERHCGYAVDNIPQLQDISDFLQSRTGFTLRPVQGLLSARDFLNALAFRVFFSTQYIRHHGNPFYTPEPDICHELIGHVPMFADRNFADFSQEIGLASLAASDEDIDRLATNYWFTVEFGLCKQDGQVKAYGAGLLSSFGEIEWSCSSSPSLDCRRSGGLESLSRPELVPFDPFVAAKQAYPITTYQPKYFVADSIADAKQRMSVFCDALNRPFFPQFDPITQSISTSKAVKRLVRTSMVKLQAEKQKQYFENKANQIKASGNEQ